MSMVTFTLDRERAESLLEALREHYEVEQFFRGGSSKLFEPCVISMFYLHFRESMKKAGIKIE